MLAEGAISALILAASFAAARLLSSLVERAIAGPHEHTDFERRLMTSLRWPLTQLLFLAGVWAALHRAPLPDPWMMRGDGLLFVAVVLCTALALLRLWGAVLARWAAEGEGRGPGRDLAPLASKVGKVFIATVALITSLQHFGINVQSLVVSLGVGSLAVGLAAQDTLANMFAGFAILLDRPFRLGDRIQLATGEVGDVEAIGIRSTLIRTGDENVLVVPNSALVKERVINQCRPTRAIALRVELAVPYSAELERVRTLLLEAAAACPLLTEPPPAVFFTRFGDMGVGVLLSARVRDLLDAGAARSQILEGAHRRLAAAGIEIPVSRPVLPR